MMCGFEIAGTVRFCGKAERLQAAARLESRLLRQPSRSRLIAQCLSCGARWTSPIVEDDAGIHTHREAEIHARAEGHEITYKLETVSPTPDYDKKPQAAGIGLDIR